MDSAALVTDRPHTLLIDEAARLMGVSRRTVYYRIREGRLQTIRTRCGSQRVVVGSLAALLAEGLHRNTRRRSARAFRDRSAAV
jgi:excisionase family DNA binding protein